MQSNVNQEGKERMMADGGEGRRGRGRGGAVYARGKARRRGKRKVKEFIV